MSKVALNEKDPTKYGGAFASGSIEQIYFLPCPFLSSWPSAEAASDLTCLGVGLMRPAKTLLASDEMRGLVCLLGFFVEGILTSMVESVI